MTGNIDINDRSRRLKGLTMSTHERLDKAIMAGDPFANVENYVKFLKVQYLFHRDMHALYALPQLDAVLPDLEGRRRFDKVVLDLSDVGADAPEADGAPRFVDGATVDLPTALGWLYVAEGSNLGAAFLLKFAARLGLDATKGARHLAPPDEGRGLHWRNFTAALDAIDLSAEEETRLTVGAEAAFTRVHGLVRRFFGGV